MSREQAENEAARLNREHPERDTHRWIARAESNGEWSIVRVRLPAGKRLDPLKTTTEAKPKPPEPDDPRPNYWRDTGGPWVG